MEGSHHRMRSDSHTETLGSRATIQARLEGYPEGNIMVEVRDLIQKCICTCIQNLYEAVAVTLDPEGGGGREGGWRGGGEMLK